MKRLAIFWLVISFFAIVSCDRELKEHPISPQVKQQMDARKKFSDPARSVSGTVDFDESITSKVPKKEHCFLLPDPKAF